MMIQKDLNFLDENATLEQVVDTFAKFNVSYCVIVDKDNNFLGMLTEGDIFQIAEEGRYSGTLPIKDFIKKYTDVAFYEDSIASVIKKMYKNGFRQIPIHDQEDKSKVLGVVSARDFISHLIEYFPETVYNVIPGQRLSTETQEGA